MTFFSKTTLSVFLCTAALSPTSASFLRNDNVESTQDDPRLLQTFDKTNLKSLVEMFTDGIEGVIDGVFQDDLSSFDLGLETTDDFTYSDTCVTGTANLKLGTITGMESITINGLAFEDGSDEIIMNKGKPTRWSGNWDLDAIFTSITAAVEVTLLGDACGAFTFEETLTGTITMTGPSVDADLAISGRTRSLTDVAGTSSIQTASISGLSLDLGTISSDLSAFENPMLATFDPNNLVTSFMTDDVAAVLNTYVQAAVNSALAGATFQI